MQKFTQCCLEFLAWSFEFCWDQQRVIFHQENKNCIKNHVWNKQEKKQLWGFWRCALTQHKLCVSRARVAFTRAHAIPHHTRTLVCRLHNQQSSVWERTSSWVDRRVHSAAVFDACNQIYKLIPCWVKCKQTWKAIRAITTGTTAAVLSDRKN